MTKRQINQEDFYFRMSFQLAKIGSGISLLKSSDDLNKLTFLPEQLDQLESRVSKWFLMIDTRIDQKKFKPFSKNALLNSLKSFVKLEEKINNLLIIDDSTLSLQTQSLICQLEKDVRILINIIDYSLS